jgi:cyclopropane-fatty-acyl-phospholipid synthase
VTAADRLRAAGTSPAAIQHHYDLSDEFFGTWLGPDMVYSCALWDEADPSDTLARAQQRKLDHFAGRLELAGGRLLDIGCGWGALIARSTAAHGLAAGTGLTLSPSQQRFAAARGVPGADYRVESWVDHEPAVAYDAITCIEMSEHLASDALDADEKVAVYRNFFERCAGWLRPGGRMGLQLICLDNVGHDGSRAGRGPLSELIRVDIFPESMPASLSELVLGWETHFRLEHFLDHPHHYRRTFRSWGLAFRGHEDEARALVGDDVVRTFARYFAGGEACFRLREHSLYRVILEKRPSPKQWAVTVWPGDLATVDPDGETERAGAPGGASASAVQSHYDLSNAFYALWLGPTMMYSSGIWDAPTTTLDQAVTAKIDRFAHDVLPGMRARVLDVGCGWGGALRRMVDEHAVRSGVGLTLSARQQQHLATDPVPGVEIRLESWADHEPTEPYDAIVSFGAFEHFARDGSTGPERIAGYRRFFARCFQWLAPGGRLGLETITHDDAPDTASPLGRGPLGDSVLELYPESLCPHLSEIVLGFEPWFEVELLQSAASDFARTSRAWYLGLRQHEQEAIALVGQDVTTRWRRYLVASELQFRMGTITNVRLVLHRRPAVRW